jgi:hypothetical protein
VSEEAAWAYYASLYKAYLEMVHLAFRYPQLDEAVNTIDRELMERHKMMDEEYGDE